MNEAIKLATEALQWLAANLEIIGASGALSTLLVGVKKWFSVQSDKVMISLLFLSAGLLAVGHYLLTAPSDDPSIIALQGAAFAVLTQGVYHFAVKPARKWLQARVLEAAELKLSQEAEAPAVYSSTATTQTFTVPGNSVSTVSTVPPTRIDVSDFSH